MDTRTVRVNGPHASCFSGSVSASPSNPGGGTTASLELEKNPLKHRGCLMICQRHKAGRWCRKSPPGCLAPESRPLSPAHPKVQLLSPTKGFSLPSIHPPQDTFMFAGLVLSIKVRAEPFNCFTVKAEGKGWWDSQQTAPRQQGSSVGMSRTTSPKRGQLSGRGPGQSRSTGTMVS